MVAVQRTFASPAGGRSPRRGMRVVLLIFRFRISASTAHPHPTLRATFSRQREKDFRGRLRHWLLLPPAGEGFSRSPQKTWTGIPAPGFTKECFSRWREKDSMVAVQRTFASPAGGRSPRRGMRVVLLIFRFRISASTAHPHPTLRATFSRQGEKDKSCHPHPPSGHLLPPAGEGKKTPSTPRSPMPRSPTCICTMPGAVVIRAASIAWRVNPRGVRRAAVRPLFVGEAFMPDALFRIAGKHRA
jgi:hypothetical protein